MSIPEALIETVEYSVALVLPESRKLLAIRDVDGYRLPSVPIPQWTRPAEQLRKAIEATFGIHALVLDFLQPIGPLQVCAAAEVLILSEKCGLDPIGLDQLCGCALDEQQRTRLDSIIRGDADVASPFSELGWIERAISWLEVTTGNTLASKAGIEQYNAGGNFSLVRFSMRDGRHYWLKATGQPNTHEPSITRLLAKLCGDYLPEFISFMPQWNAWLMSGEAVGLKDLPEEPLQLFAILEKAVESMARIQMKTQGHSLTLLSAGAFDQGLPVFLRCSHRLFDYLEESMALQISTRVRRLENKRLREMREIFEETCERMASLELGECILHGDLNLSNILIGARHCQFIDWCETYIGPPVISLQHLLLLNRTGSTEVREFINGLLKRRYLDVWSESCNPEVLKEAFLYMPLLAVASALYGRGDWLDSPRNADPRRRSYARSLARHMDRASQEPRFMEALCH